MTQGAIDLVQAEMITPVESAVLLLQNKPCLGPRLLDTQPAQAQKPLLQPIADYTWWDSKSHICISVSIHTGISTEKLSPGQVQCNIQQQQLHCTITPSAPHSLTQHRLSIRHLHACVHPGQSTCLLDGQAVLLEQNTPKRPPSVSQAHDTALQSVSTPVTCSTLLQCNSSPQSSMRAHDTSIAPSQQATSLSLRSSSARHLQPIALQPAATAPACVSQVLIRLMKADASQPWETLAQPPASSQPCKLAAPSEESMAALRRTLIHQRQQTQAQQGRPVPNPLPVAAHRPAAPPLPAVDLTEAAAAPDDKLQQGLHFTAPAGSQTCSPPALSMRAIQSMDCKGPVQKILPGAVKVCHSRKASSTVMMQTLLGQGPTSLDVLAAYC